MKITDIFYVIFNNAYIKVKSNSSYTFYWIQKEFEGFYKVTRKNIVNHEKLLASLKLVINDKEYKAERDKIQKNKNSENIIYHKPLSYRHEKRYGLILKEGTKKNLLSITRQTVFKADDKDKSILIFHGDEKDGTNELRRILRDQILIPYNESIGNISVHAAGINGKDGSYLVIGKQGSGKSSVYLAGMLESEKFSFGSGDRSLIVRRGKQLHVCGIPEKLRLFEGTLLSFLPLNHFSNGLPRHELWERQKKTKVNLFDIFKSFGVHGATPFSEFKLMIFPQYNKGVGRLHYQEMTGAEMNEILKREIFTGSDSVRSNWIGWYSPNEYEAMKTYNLLLKVKSIYFEWSTLNHIQTFLQNIESI